MHQLLRFVFCALLAAIVCLPVNVNAQGGQPFITRQTFGANGGHEFAPVADIESIALRSGSRVDQISINDVRHGGGGGTPANGGQTLILAPDEYISAFTIRSGNEIDYVSFTTSKGRTIGGGGRGGGYLKKEGIRVLSIGGRSGSRVDQLAITWVENYSPATEVVSDQDFIVDFIAPGKTIVEYVGTESRTLATYEKTMALMTSWESSANVEAAFYGKVSASTRLAGSSTSTEVVRRELENKLNKSTTTTQVIGEDEIGLYVVSQTIMSSIGNDGVTPTYWVYPKRPSTGTRLIVLKLADYESLLNKFDLTRQLSVQIPRLAPYKVEKYGFLYLQKP